MTYSSSLALSRQRYASRNRNSTSFRAKEATIGPISNTVILIVLACILGLLYLTQVTKTNALGYQAEDLRSEKQSLVEEKAELEVTSARLQALNRIKDSDVAKGLVSVSPQQTVQQ